MLDNMKFTIGPTTALALIFTTLKLCNVICWSWVWVLSPLWIPFVIAFAMYVLVFLACLIASR